MTALVRYEYPFNEKVRAYLRLDKLFHRFHHAALKPTPEDHHFAIISLFEYLDVSARSDMKSDVLKDLDRYQQVMKGYRQVQSIDPHVLESTIDHLRKSFDQLERVQGKIGTSLFEHDWLSAIRSRIAIPGGTCEFDLPAYHAWLNLDSELRTHHLLQWEQAIHPLSEGISTLLGLIRGSGTPKAQLAHQGKFQLSLSNNRSYQMAVLQINPDSGVFPELSGNRIVLSVRFWPLTEMLANRASNGQRLEPCTDDISFQLSLCS